MKPGIYYDISNEDYHSGPGVSSTTFKKIGRSPAHSQVPEEEKPAYRFGELFHRFLELGRDKWEDSVAVASEGMKFTTKDGKEFKRIAEERGLDIVKYDEAKAIYRMAENCLDLHLSEDKTVRDLWQKSRREVSHFWIDESTGLLCKCRSDVENTKISTILDWKTCQDAREHATQNAMASYGYHESAAFYLDGTGLDYFIWCWVEKTPPYAAQLEYCHRDDEIIQVGRVLYRRHLDIYKRCLDSGTWPAYADVPRQATLPSWASREYF